MLCCDSGRSESHGRPGLQCSEKAAIDFAPGDSDFLKPGYDWFSGAAMSKARMKVIRVSSSQVIHELGINDWMKPGTATFGMFS
jgi:hypothetical protein